jgi:hypothetical protein
VILTSVLLGAMMIDSVEHPGIDVWRAHTGAAKLLSEGSNPYTDLNLTLEPGQTSGPLRQYFYPPVSLAWYSTWTLALGDPRWGSLVAWLVLIGLGSAFALRSENPSLAISLLAFVAVQPGWFFLLAGSFTEPLVVMLIATSIAVGSRRPTLAMTILGLGLASKQHLLLAAPILAIDLWRSYPRRSIVLVVSTTAAFLSGIAFGPVAYLRAVLVGPTLAMPNNDGVSLHAVLEKFGLALPSPTWLPVAAALAVTLVVAKSRVSSGWPANRIALVMATFLSFVSFAIWSHWMIVTLMLALSLFAVALKVPSPLDTLDE